MSDPSTAATHASHLLTQTGRARKLVLADNAVTRPLQTHQMMAIHPSRATEAAVAGRAPLLHPTETSVA
jgi:hypothetical protein